MDDYTTFIEQLKKGYYAVNGTPQNSRISEFDEMLDSLLRAVDNQEEQTEPTLFTTEEFEKTCNELGLTEDN